MKLHHFSIGTRLAIGFGVVLLLATIASGIGLWCLNNIAESTRAMMQEPLKKERMTSEWYRITVSGLKRTLGIVKSSDKSLADFFASDAKAGNTRNNEIQAYMLEHASTPEEKQLLNNIVSVRKDYVAMRDQIAKAKKDDRLDEVAQLFEQFVPKSDAYQNSELAFLEYQQKTVDQLAQQIDELAARSRTLIIAFILFFVLTGGTFAWFLRRNITTPLRHAVNIARRVADGDLTSQILVDSKDETGQLMQALKDMNQSLEKMVHAVRDSSDTILHASTEIANGNMDLSARTESQAGSLEETASSMEELTSAMKLSSENADEADQLAHAASDAAVKGGAVVAQVVDTMGSISSSSKKIVDIIGVIDGIAFQTNILALNAAVEAARAGEQGRGFAVVASEVRNLAQRSASAAKEIKTLIDDSVEKVNEGARLVDQAGSSMSEIVTRVKQVTDIMGNLHHASAEQSSGIQQINQAIIQMDDVTQQNAALVEQAAAAAQSLQDQASRLSNEVSVFQLNQHAYTPTPTRAQTHLALTM